MKRLLVIVFLLSIVTVQHAWADVSIEGSSSLFDYANWLPKKAYIDFTYNTQGKITGYVVMLEASNGKLFKELMMRKSNGETQRFPFVLEATLIIEDQHEVNRTNDWGSYESLGDVCISDKNNSYLDSTLLDDFDGDGVDRYGIGILRPDRLEEGEIYTYWIGLKESSFNATDPRTLNVLLRFRLNIDLSAAKKFGYTADELARDFALGTEWRLSYSIASFYETPSPEDIGEKFSFAIKKYNPSGYPTHSDFFVLDGMEGQWCKSGDTSPERVFDYVDCFGDSAFTDDSSDFFYRLVSSLYLVFDTNGLPPIPQPLTPKPLPNLRLSEMKVYRGDTLLVSGRNQSQAGESLTIESFIVSEEAPCTNGGNPNNVDSEVQVQIGSGDWETIDIVQTQPSTLTKGNPHKETTLYLIPEVARGKKIGIRTIVDSNNEIKETNENDNISDPNNERYPIVGSYNLAVANAGLTNGNAQVYQNSIGRVRYAIANTGPDTPLSSQGIRTVSEVKKPGEASFTLIAEDGSDSEEFTPNRLQEESTSLDGFSFNLPGIWTFRIRTDCYNKLIETNESDNELTFTVNVIPDNRRAIISITEAKLKEGSSFKKNTRVHPICKVKNTGDAYPAGAITIDYLIDGKRRDGDTIQASELGPGVEKEEKVNNDNIKLGDKGNRTLTVVAKVNGAEVARRNYSFKVK